MSSTNKTTKLQLPVYVATDSPTYLGDWNGAMNAIDNFATDIQEAVDNVKAGVEGSDYGTLNTAVQNLQQSVTNLTSTISALQNKDTSLETSINSVQSVATTAQSVAETAKTKGEATAQKVTDIQNTLLELQSVKFKPSLESNFSAYGGSEKYDVEICKNGNSFIVVGVITNTTAFNGYEPVKIGRIPRQYASANHRFFGHGQGSGTATFSAYVEGDTIWMTRYHDKNDNSNVGAGSFLGFTIEYYQ